MLLGVIVGIMINKSYESEETEGKSSGAMEVKITTSASDLIMSTTTSTTMTLVTTTSTNSESEKCHDPSLWQG